MSGRWHRLLHRAASARLAVLLVAALALACGGTAPAARGAASGSVPAAPAAGGKPTTVAELAGYQGADRQQVLEEGARREGKLTWYTSLTGPIIDRLLAGYQQKYPYVE